MNIDLEEIGLTGGGTSVRRWLTSDAVRAELAPSYSPDGNRVAYFVNRRGAEIEGLWIMDSGGSNAAQVLEDERINIFPRWSRDGQSLIYTSRPPGPAFWEAIDLRRIAVAGGLPEKLPIRVNDPFSDLGPHGRVLVSATVDHPAQIIDVHTGRVQTLHEAVGTQLRWSPDGRRFAAIVSARQQHDPAAGLWVYGIEGGKRHVFRGWAAHYAWAGVDDLIVLEGKPSLNGTLWRIRADGSQQVKAGSLALIYSYWHFVLTTRFDVHPDGQRMIAEGLELHEADVSMLQEAR
jgi:Tol biopolymer transport system component